MSRAAFVSSFVLSESFVRNLVLWQFMGLIDSNDSMIAHMGETLRVRIRTQLEVGAVASNPTQDRLCSIAASATRGVE